MSSSPHGPFSSAAPVEGADGDAIDPAALVDDDGSVYYYWGQYHLRGARLKKELSGIDPDTLNTHILTEAEHGFHEGPSVRKRNGIYYLIYTDTSRGKATSLAYATSRSPLGPFTKKGIIIDNDGCDPDTWNNHGSIAEFNGKWYVFYHRATRGGRFSRRVCIEPIAFTSEGLIEEVQMTTQGAGAPLPAAGFTEAWRASLLSGKAFTAPCDPPSPQAPEMLSNLHAGDYALYRHLTFTDSLDSFTAIFSSADGGWFEVRLNGPEGELLAAGEIPAGGSSKGWKPVTVPLMKRVSGAHALCILVQGPDGRVGDLLGFTFEAEEG